MLCTESSWHPKVNSQFILVSLNWPTKALAEVLGLEELVQSLESGNFIRERAPGNIVSSHSPERVMGREWTGSHPEPLPSWALQSQWSLLPETSLQIAFLFEQVSYFAWYVTIFSQWPGGICWNAGVCCQGKQMQEDFPEVGWRRGGKLGGKWEVGWVGGGTEWYSSVERRSNIE